MKFFKNTFEKTLFYKEYESPIKYGYKPEHKVKTYIKFTMYFDFKEWLRFTVTVPNVSFCHHNPFKAFINALEHESIGMAKYQRIKEDINRNNLYNKINLE